MDLLKVPTADELAGLSLNQLDQYIRIAYQQLQEIIQMQQESAESRLVYYTYENERMKRQQRSKTALPDDGLQDP